MAISFEFIPPNMLLPLFYAEVTPAAEPYSSNLRVCLIGHANRDDTDTIYNGTALDNVLYNVTREDATNLFGAGSQLEWMYEACRENAPFAEIWTIAIPPAAGAVKAAGAIDIIADASVNRQGPLCFFIAGREVCHNVRSTDTAEQIAKALQGIINSKRLPVKASGATGGNGQTSITLTCRWAGITGNEITMSIVGPHGRRDANTPGARLARKFLDFTAMTLGSLEAEAPQTFSVIGDRPFDVFVMPYSTQAQLDAAQTFMDGAAGRWSPFRQKYGHFVTTKKGAFQALYDLLDSRNDPHMTILGLMQTIMPTWEWSGALAGVIATHWSAPPELSRPLQTLVLRGMYIGSDDDESFDPVERNILLDRGLSTIHVNDDTSCAIDRIRTTRKENAYGDPDPSWADAVTMFQASYFVKAMRAAITNAFPRCALSDEPTGINGFTSAPEIAMVLIHEYERLVSLGLVENADLFAEFLVVERDGVDRNRVNVLMRPDVVNQLRVVATVVETHLELDAENPLLQAA